MPEHAEYADQLSRELMLRWDVEDPSCVSIWQSLSPHRQQHVIGSQLEAIRTADTERFMDATRFLARILPIIPLTARQKYRGSCSE
jgi:hypothetical protein